nr:acyltransferase family protein [Formosa haliotis]
MLSEITNIQLLQRAADYNYLFSRLGAVGITFGVFYALESYLKHKVISKIGNNTLSIYVVHFIILYGSFTGIGLYAYYNKALEPWTAIIGALFFMISVCVIVLLEEKTKAFLYDATRKALNFIGNTGIKSRLNRR